VNHKNGLQALDVAGLAPEAVARATRLDGGLGRGLSGLGVPLNFLGAADGSKWRGAGGWGWVVNVCTQQRGRGEGGMAREVVFTARPTPQNNLTLGTS